MNIAIDPLDKINTDIPAATRLNAGREFDVDAILGDTGDLEGWSDKSHPTRRSWFLIPYRDIGDVDEERARTLLDNRPYVTELFRDFPGEVEHALISMIGPGIVLKAHSDLYASKGRPKPKFPMFNSTLRFHIPLVTHEHAHFYSDGRFYDMGEGELWMINNSLQHGVINQDPERDRYHLIFDVTPNDQTLELLRTAEVVEGYTDDALKRRLMPQGKVLTYARSLIARRPGARR